MKQMKTKIFMSGFLWLCLELEIVAGLLEVKQ